MVQDEDEDEDDVFTTIYRESYSRFIVENGQKVEKPANKWMINLKDFVPEGCEVAQYLDILKQVVGSDANEVYDEAVSYNAFYAILTDEEHDKFLDLEQVSKLVQDNDFIELC